MTLEILTPFFSTFNFFNRFHCFLELVKLVRGKFPIASFGGQPELSCVQLHSGHVLA